MCLRVLLPKGGEVVFQYRVEDEAMDYIECGGIVLGF